MKYLRIKRFFSYLILIVPLLFPAGCDEGIKPVEKSGFSGKVTFNGMWPADVVRTHLVVFQTPLNAVTDFNIFNLKFVSEEITRGSAEYFFSSEDSSVIPGTGQFAAGQYAYVAVAQQRTPELSLLRRDWTVAGVYYTNGDTGRPGLMIIPEKTFVEDINITCDFNNPPPQPPGGN